MSFLFRAMFAGAVSLALFSTCLLVLRSLLTPSPLSSTSTTRIHVPGQSLRLPGTAKDYGSSNSGSKPALNDDASQSGASIVPVEEQGLPSDNADLTAGDGADTVLPAIWDWSEVQAEQGHEGAEPGGSQIAVKHEGNAPAAPATGKSSETGVSGAVGGESSPSSSPSGPSTVADPPLTIAADPFFGSDADLSHHQNNQQCWDHFDFGLLESWSAANQVFCAPRAPTSVPVQASELAVTAGNDGDSWLRCRVMNDAHLPAPTAPHTMCDGANIIVDPSHMQPIACLPSRPGYKCDGPAIHWQFQFGSLSASCAKTPSFGAQAFPRDHLMDMFNGFNERSAPVADVSPSSGDIVLIIARERQEHANPFHATTDFLNAFYSLHMAEVIDGHTGDRKDMARVQVLLMDEQRGPFDDTILKRVFSPQHDVLRIADLQRGGSEQLRLPHAIFVPPGYSNMLLAHVATDGDCHAGTQLFQSFRRFVLDAFGLGRVEERLPSATDPPVVVTFISRRPYNAFVEHNFIGRQIDNEEALISAMQAVPGVKVTRYDFARMEVAQQLEVMASSEVLVGMHGAALTFALFMPHHGSVVELWPKDRDMWRCFEHISAMSGLEYHRLENNNPDAFRVDGGGDYTIINIARFTPMFQAAVTGSRKRRGKRMETTAASVTG